MTQFWGDKGVAGLGIKPRVYARQVLSLEVTPSSFFIFMCVQCIHCKCIFICMGTHAYVPIDVCAEARV